MFSSVQKTDRSYSDPNNHYRLRGRFETHFYIVLSNNYSIFGIYIDHCYIKTFNIQMDKPVNVISQLFTY